MMDGREFDLPPAPAAGTEIVSFFVVSAFNAFGEPESDGTSPEDEVEEVSRMKEERSLASSSSRSDLTSESRTKASKDREDSSQ